MEERLALLKAALNSEVGSLSKTSSGQPQFPQVPRSQENFRAQLYIPDIPGTSSVIALMLCKSTI